MIVSGIRTLFDNLSLFLGQLFTNLTESIKGFFDSFLDNLKSIFIPDPEVLSDQFEDFKLEIEGKFNLHFSAIESLKNVGSRPVEDVNESYDFGPYVGTLNVKFFDASPLIQALGTFRPIIRGFVFFLLIIFNVNQSMSFIGQHSGIANEIRRSGSGGGGSDDS